MRYRRDDREPVDFLWWLLSDFLTVALVLLLAAALGLMWLMAANCGCWRGRCPCQQQQHCR